jgi:hypothetical protein
MPLREAFGERIERRIQPERTSGASFDDTASSGVALAPPSRTAQAVK